MEFVHLHNHTEYSLLDGACRIYDNFGKPASMIKLARKYNMPALAITDHGNLFGAIEFYQACMEEGIKPIIGLECYLESAESDQRKSLHITLLARNNTGYKNLLKLISKGYTENLIAGKAKIKKEWLNLYNEGIIALSGCVQGEIADAILEKKSDSEIKNILDFYISIFGKDNFYIEIMDNNLSQQKEVIPKLIQLSRYSGIGVVATNDVHYVSKNDAKLQEILLCIGTGTTLDNPKRLKFETDEFYFKSPQEMCEIFRDYPEAIKNTLTISERCNVTINFDDIFLPEFKLPNGEDPNEYLKNLCYVFLPKKYPNYSAEVKERLDYELSIIKKMGFAPYFLIVQDFINYAREKQIPVGPGRGSGAGSLVSYCLGITNIDPLKYGLLFERFLNPERKTLPDLDIDFADYRRDEIINYVCQKYGTNNVVRIITFNTIKARNAIRDVARVMSLPIALADKVAKLVPHNLTIDQALKQVSELKTLYNKEENIKTLLEYAKQVEGFKRHTGIHAAGVIIAKGDITDYVPLFKRSKDDPVTTQFYDELVLKLGLLKMDFLGLRTLSVLEEVVKLVKKNYGLDIDVDKIPLDDEKTFKLLQSGNTVGIFQLESSGMRDLLKKMRPTVFEDIIACNALFRPGPIGSGMVTQFVERKHKRSEIKYDHKLLVDILKDTYGIIVYQEQVMQIANVLAGFSPAEADTLRKAIAKKIPEEIKSLEEKFIDGARKKGVDARTAQKIYDQIAHFGEYGFNKSHATAYALISYQCAYFKANYTIEYIIAMLNSELRSGANVKSGQSEEEKRFIKYIIEAENMGFELLPPDINKSEEFFTKENPKAIRFALVAIRNVGLSSAEFIVNLRKKTGMFKSYEDFIARCDCRQVNKKVVEALIFSGALDSLSGSSEMSIEEKCVYRKNLISKLNKNEKTKFQQEFFFNNIISENELKDERFTEQELFNFEHEFTDVYWSGHPLEKYQKEIEMMMKNHIGDLPEEDGKKVEIVGMIVNIKKQTTKNGQSWAKIVVEDLTGEVEVILFAKVFETVSGILQKNNIIFVSGKLSLREEQKTIIAEQVMSFEKAKENIYKNYKKMFVTISSVGMDEDYMNKLKKTLEKYPGEVKVYFRIISKNYEEVLIETNHKIIPSNKMIKELNNLVSETSYQFE